jgi:hypothetical protein
VFLVTDVLTEDGAKDIFRSNEMDSNVVVACSEDGPAYLRIGGLVGAHGVNHDVDWHQETITGFLL